MPFVEICLTDYHLVKSFIILREGPMKCTASMLAFVGLTLLTLACEDNADTSAPDGCKGAIVFPDANLEAELRKEIEKQSGSIRYKDISSLTEFRPMEAGIVDLEGIQCLTNLERLMIYSNEIVDVSALSDLVNLKWLNLSRNQIADLGPLSNLKKLEYQWLFGNQISDISIISGLTNIKDLDLRDNQITEIVSLVANAGLQSGDDIDITENPINCDDQENNLNILLERGVTVESDCD
jgi:internalin A